MERLKALLHVDEMNRWKIALANAKNLLADIGKEQVTLEIVANAEAVRVFDTKYCMEESQREYLIQQMAQLSQYKVSIAVCRNALRANEIEEEMVPPFAAVVPAGITRIVMQQAEGYAYVKP